MTETITFRIATADDLDEIVKMLADDVLGNKESAMKHHSLIVI